VFRKNPGSLQNEVLKQQEIVISVENFQMREERSGSLPKGGRASLKQRAPLLS